MVGLSLQVVTVYLYFLIRYMAPPPPPPYDPYGGYPIAPVPMPTPAPIAAPSSYVPVQELDQESEILSPKELESRSSGASNRIA
ncbi:hypothetical protein Ahy_B03g063660 isoform D [Arachis hypogaea]|uniref:Uncharacterized protein n=1 Tax=Arachis hypogaea TaxID=3818 RepID=A0A444ZY70_ARAHY|nr:hypothetical protein Ahy_B03g063660 isoform D [Arachis hypogaea]